MDDELFFEAKKYLSSKAAGRRAGYTHDYVSRLARQKKIPGRLVGRTWYVEEESFTQFLSSHTEAKERWYDELSKTCRDPYTNGETSTPAQKSLEEVEKSFLQPRAIFRSSFFEPTGAFAAAIILVFGSYYLVANGAAAVGFQTALQHAHSAAH